VANSAITPTYPLRLCSLLVVMVLLLTACAGAGNEDGSASTSVTDELTHRASGQPADQVEARGEQTEDAQEAEATEETDKELIVDFDELLAAALENEPLPLDSGAIGSDLILGGSPDSVSAATITQGLEDAGFDLVGIEVSVWPITGMDASLIVMEVRDEAITVGDDESDDDDAFMKTLLAMPEIEEASVAEIVTVYRGVDDQGSFVFTVTMPISALEQALASGSEIEDDMLVQIERSS
jgi:hypothetical protein